MLAGHLEVALGTRKVDRELPPWVLVAAVFWLDLVWPVLLLAGIESVRVNPGDTAFTSLAFDHYPWTHSLLAASLWAAAACGLSRLASYSWRSGLTVGCLVLSHWVLDFVSHRPDLPLWPGGPLVGLGLWNSVVGTFAVEGGLYLGALWLYLRATSGRDRTGRYALASLALLIGILWASQPWAPPPPSATAVAWGALAMWSLLPWAAWIDRHRRSSE